MMNIEDGNRFMRYVAARCEIDVKPFPENELGTKLRFFVVTITSEMIALHPDPIGRFCERVEKVKKNFPGKWSISFASKEQEKDGTVYYFRLWQLMDREVTL